jgi:serpin B
MTDAVEGVHVSKAIHKAKIEVSLEGLKAAAATAFMMDKNASMPLEQNVDTVRIDKPFMYIIKDSSNNEVWFVGTVYNFSK